MKNVTVRLSDEYVETLDEEADNLDVSRARHLRDLIEKGREVEEIQSELEATQAKVEDLRRQLQAANSRERDVDDLVEYVEEERQIQRRREERRQANMFRRAWWFVAGAPVEDSGK